jgi:hypothetical protein
LVGEVGRSKPPYHFHQYHFVEVKWCLAAIVAVMRRHHGAHQVDLRITHPPCGAESERGVLTECHMPRSRRRRMDCCCTR